MTIYKSQEEAITNRKCKDRYIIIGESVSAHCCFSYSIIDTSKGVESYGHYYIGYVCETFEEPEALLIANSLNHR